MSGFTQTIGTPMRVEREQLYEHLGIKNAQVSMGSKLTEYTPVTLDAKGKTNNTNTRRGAYFTFSQVMKHPVFMDTQTMMMNLPERVHLEEVYVKKDETYHSLPKKRAVVGDVSGRPTAIVSNIFKPIQTCEMYEGVRKALDNTGLNIAGCVNQTETESHGFIFVGDKDADHNLLPNDVGRYDPSLMGIHIWNGNDAKTSVGAEFFGMRIACGNGMTLRSLMGSVSLSHYTGVEKVYDMVEFMLINLADRIPFMQEKFALAKQTSFKIDETEALLVGIGLPKGNVENIMNNYQQLNPEIPAGSTEITAYDIYNMGTAYYSHRSMGGNMTSSMIDFSRDLESIIAGDAEKYVSKGFKMLEATA